ncbi:lipopolysaccharide biosynthesis protein [Nevskia sp.]|uniref:lipopolysaccharide biosynthesis protein n=1 Tax=Nevskia sp. TaxID=1929292 RepID=UPI0025D04147|nr:lipopolysaccharide biosynthesis protein [Nevskia sp.]
MLGNAGILLGGKALNGALSLGATALAARTLGVDMFGVLVLVHAYVQTVGEIAKFQSWQALLQYGTAPLAEGRLVDFQRVLRFSLALDGLSGIGGIVIALIGVQLIGSALGWPGVLAPEVSAYSLVIVFMVSATPTGALRLLDRFDLLAWQSSVDSWVRVIGAAIAWQCDAGLSTFLAIWFAGQVAAFTFLFGMASRTLRARGALDGFELRAPGPLTDGFPGLWSFVWSTNLNSTLALAFTHVGTLMVGALLGARDAALFRVAKQLGDAVAKPAKLIVPALYPELARLAAASDQTVLRRLVWQLALAAGGAASVLLLIAALIREPALRFIVGEEFVAAKDVLLWLLGASVVSLWALPLEPLLMSTGSAGAAFRMRLLVTLLYLPLLYFATIKGGLTAAGAASVIGALMLFVGQLWLVLRWYRRPNGPPAAPGKPGLVDTI